MCNYLKTESEKTAEGLNEAGMKAASAIRSWSYSTFYNALSDGRSANEKKNILENFFYRLPNYLTSSLGWHCYDVPIVAVHMEKVLSESL